MQHKRHLQKEGFRTDKHINPKRVSTFVHKTWFFFHQIKIGLIKFMPWAKSLDYKEAKIIACGHITIITT